MEKGTMTNINYDAAITASTHIREKIADEVKGNLSLDIAAESLGYAHRSSVSRAMAKERMSMSDLLKLMTLVRLRKITITKPFPVTIELKAQSMQDCDDLIAALRTSVLTGDQVDRNRLPAPHTWDNISVIAKFANRRGAWSSWFLLETPIYIVLLVLRVLGWSNHTITLPTITDPKGLSLTISM